MQRSVNPLRGHRAMDSGTFFLSVRRSPFFVAALSSSLPRAGSPKLGSGRIRGFLEFSHPPKLEGRPPVSPRLKKVASPAG